MDKNDLLALEILKLREQNATLRAALEMLTEAEWMVTHDWGGDRDVVLSNAIQALATTPPTQADDEQGGV